MTSQYADGPVEFFQPAPQVTKEITDTVQALQREEDDDEAFKGHLKQSRLVKGAVALENARQSLTRSFQQPRTQRFLIGSAKIAVALVFVFALLFLRWSHVVERTERWADVVISGECQLPPRDRVRDIPSRCREAVEYKETNTLERFSQAALEDVQSLVSWAQTWTGFLSLLLIVAFGIAAGLLYMSFVQSGALTNCGFYLNSFRPDAVKGSGCVSV